MNLRIPQAILSERRRQIDSEGWSAKHDDQHSDGSLRAAALCYFKHATGVAFAPLDWPWGHKWWKPKDPARDLERAGALCLAEIDRLDRRVPKTNDDAIHMMAIEDLLEKIVAAYNG